MSEATKLLWRQTKARLIARFGTVEAAAKALSCSVSGLRSATEGKCPGIRQKLQEAGLFLGHHLGAAEYANRMILARHLAKQPRASARAATTTK